MKTKKVCGDNLAMHLSRGMKNAAKYFQDKSTAMPSNQLWLDIAGQMFPKNCNP